MVSGVVVVNVFSIVVCCVVSVCVGFGVYIVVVVVVFWWCGEVLVFFFFLLCFFFCFCMDLCVSGCVGL